MSPNTLLAGQKETRLVKSMATYYWSEDPRMCHVLNIHSYFSPAFTTGGLSSSKSIEFAKLKPLRNGYAFGNGDASDEDGVVCSEQLDFHMLVHC